MNVLDGRFARISQVVIASVLSFTLGTVTGGVSTYTTIRADAAALTARVAGQEQRVTTLEQSVSEWRAADAETARELAAQIHQAVEVLTDLRIRLGPNPTLVKP